MIYSGHTMGYLWDDFNIKTFPADTAVFQNGLFMPELSEPGDGMVIENNKIIIQDGKWQTPVHIIYVGDIAMENNLHIDIKVAKRPVFLTAKINCKKSAFLNIFIKNAGKNSEFWGNLIAQNHGHLEIGVFGEHFVSNTGLFMQNRIVAHDNSYTKLIGRATINHNMENCENDIGFSVMAAPSAKIEFAPEQFISCPPKLSEHSASIYTPSVPVIQYLRGGGLGIIEIKEILEQAFISDSATISLHF